MRRSIPLVLAAILLTSCASYTVRDGLDRITVPETGFLVPVKKAEIDSLNAQREAERNRLEAEDEAIRQALEEGQGLVTVESAL